MWVSDRRNNILKFIRSFIEERGYAPTLDEIRTACCISSKSVVEYHLRVLERKGLILRDAAVARSIRISGMEKRGRAVPLLGVIAAGEPIPVPAEDTWQSIPQEIVEIPDYILPARAQVYALKVKGRSMVDALVDDGDIVVLDTAGTADDGQMVAAWLSDREEATLKKLYREPGRIRLQPANKSMGPIYVAPEYLQVQGRVVAVLRSYNARP